MPDINRCASHVGITQVQPIVAYRLGQGWALSAGDLQYTYDWERGGWVVLPIGFLQERGETVADRLITVGGLVLTAAGLLLLVLHWDVLAKVGWYSMGALVALMLAALLVAYVVAAAVVSIPYLRWRRRVESRASAVLSAA